MAHNVEFDLQEILRDMATNNTKRHEALMSRLDHVVSIADQNSVRLNALERDVSLVKRVGGAVFSALGLGLVGLAIAWVRDRLGLGS